MIVALNRQVGNTLEFTITIAWQDITKTYDKIVNKLISEIEIKGFRKGKAPRDLAEKQIDKSKVYEEVVRELIPKAYSDAVSQHGVKPILTPKVELVEAKEDKDWQIKIQTCEKPIVKLGKYREMISKLITEKKGKIWLPGETKKEEKKDEDANIAEVLDALYKEIEVELSPLMLEEEVNRMLSNLINETQKLGITVEDYLRAQSKTKEILTAEYQNQAKKTLALEFALEEIADKEKIAVEDSEVETIIKNAKNENERKQLSSQRYYLASLLRRQKTIKSLLTPKIVTV